MNKEQKLFKSAVLMLFISSFSLIFSIFGNYDTTAFRKILAISGAVLFWLCLIVGYVFFALISERRKAYERRHRERGVRPEKKAKPGILCFFSNKFAMIADVTMAISLVATLVFLFAPTLNQNLAVIFVAVLLFSAHMHGILNGVNFKYIESLNRKGE